MNEVDEISALMSAVKGADQALSIVLPTTALLV